MSVCINTNTAEFQTLVKLSGLPDIYVSAICGDFIEKYNRFPYLDELAGADSSNYLKTLLKLNDLGYTSKERIFNMTGKNNIPESLILLNLQFKDVEVELLELSLSVKTTIRKRPITKPIENSIRHSTTILSNILFENIIDKLRSLYGILLNQLDTESIKNSELVNIPGVLNAKAFVYKGLIYINTDLANKDAPIHEMMHILMGEIRYSNPLLYFGVISEIQKMPFFSLYTSLIANRTMSDIAEEAFIEEFSKLVSLKESDLELLPENIKYELFYNAKRVLDSILMGESSIKDYNDYTIFNSSLIELCQLVNSSLDAESFKGTITFENGEIHRLLSNKKLELIELNKLEEYCYG